MPSSIIWEGRFVRKVLPVDDERQQDSSLHVQLAPQLELIGKDGRSIREDGRYFVPFWVPLDTDAHTEE